MELLLSIEVMIMSRKVRVGFVLMDYSPAAMYNLKVAKRLYDKVYAITLYTKRDDIGVEQIQFNPYLDRNIYEQLGEFVKHVADELNVTGQYILLLPFNVKQRKKFLEVNKILSRMGVKNEAPSKGLTDEQMINFVNGGG